MNHPLGWSVPAGFSTHLGVLFHGSVKHCKLWCLSLSSCSSRTRKCKMLSKAEPTSTSLGRNLLNPEKVRANQQGFLCGHLMKGLLTSCILSRHISTSTAREASEYSTERFHEEGQTRGSTKRQHGAGCAVAIWLSYGRGSGVKVNPSV